MRICLTLLCLLLVLGFTVLNYGGATPDEWNVTLVFLCGVSLAFWLSGSFLRGPENPASAVSLPVLLLSAALIAYIGMQLLPLPVGWLSVLSPARAEILRAVAPFDQPNRATLSVSPQLTFAQLLRLLAYLQVFFLVRELSAWLAGRCWLSALPLLLLASAEAVIGLAQHFETGGFATGTYMNHGHLSGLLEMALPLALMLIPLPFRPERREGSVSGWAALQVCGSLACAVCLILGIVYTAARMGLVVALASVLILVLLGLSAGRELTRGLLPGVLAAGALLLSAPLILITRFAGDLTADVRFGIWRDTWKLIAQYPAFGSGFGTYVSAIQKYRAATPLALVDQAHNDYLQLTAELGFAGFALLAALCLLILKDAFTTARGARDTRRRALATGCVASLTGFALHGLVDFQFYIPANMMAAAWIAGMASTGGTAVSRKGLESKLQ